MFLEKGSPTHYMVGLKILNTLVTEMNNATPGRTLTQHRKASGACVLSAAVALTARSWVWVWVWAGYGCPGLGSHRSRLYLLCWDPAAGGPCTCCALSCPNSTGTKLVRVPLVLSWHAQIAVSFRDTALFRCFQAALSALQEMPAKGADNKLKEQVRPSTCTHVLRLRPAICPTMPCHPSLQPGRSMMPLGAGSGPWEKLRSADEKQR